MAVYTHLSAEALAELIGHYDVGELLSAKGIAEGVSNSNWLLETTKSRYILTMYERRIELSDLPFFLSLLDHLAARGGPVPATIHDRNGNAYREIDSKAVALIEFLPGVSVDNPTAQQAYAVGRALASVHRDSASFAMTRQNDLRPKDWDRLFRQCGGNQISAIHAELLPAITQHMPEMLTSWPDQLPMATIHADLFPDNVLMLGDTVSGLIDFYFACTDFAVYDLAVTHAAWCFSNDGREFNQAISAALIGGYQSLRPLIQAETDALPVLAKGAAMRFVATRTFDWIDTPAGAIVTRKDPMDFVRRLNFYDKNGADAFL